MNHISSYFSLMVVFWYGADPGAMDPSCYQNTMQAGSSFIMLWGVFIWHELGLLFCLTTLASDCNIELLHDHFPIFIGNFLYPKIVELLQQDNAVSSKIPRTALRSILKTSDE